MKQNPRSRLRWQEIGLFCIPVLVPVLIWLLPFAKQWRLDRAQDRFYVINNFSEPIAKLHVKFYGGYEHNGIPTNELIFRNVPGHSQQWQRFGPTWGNSDSGRPIDVDIVTSSGRTMHSDDEFVPVDDSIPSFGFGARFYVTLRRDGTIEVQPNY